MNYCFGVDIGGTTVKIGLFEETGTIVEKWEIPTNTLADGEAILPDIAFSVKNKDRREKTIRRRHPRDRSRSSGACDGRRNCKRERKSRMEI